MDADAIAELFAEFGPVSVRRMFSGAGVFVDGLMIALVTGGVIHLKADAQTIPAFESEGLGPFTYATKAGERSLGSYWRMPERLYDDTEELARWAHEAHAAARRASSGSPRPRKRAPKVAGTPPKRTRRPAS